MLKTSFYVSFSLLLTATFLSSCASQNEKPRNMQTHADTQSESQKNMSFQNVETIRIKQTYKTLRLLELDQMTDLLYEKTNEYKNNNNIQALREGVLIAFSRPNEEVILDKIISIVRSPLEDLNEWEPTIEQMVGQSIQVLESKSATGTDQVTASVVLENVLSEFKPFFVKQYQSGGFQTSIIERIAAADVQFSKQALQEKSLNLMKSGLTPSQIAQKLIDLKNQKLEQQRKAQEGK